MLMIVKWNRDGKKGQSGPMSILAARALVREGCDGWGKLSHWSVMA